MWYWNWLKVAEPFILKIWWLLVREVNTYIYCDYTTTNIPLSIWPICEENVCLLPLIKAFISPPFFSLSLFIYQIWSLLLLFFTLTHIRTHWVVILSPLPFMAVTEFEQREKRYNWYYMWESHQTRPGHAFTTRNLDFYLSITKKTMLPSFLPTVPSDLPTLSFPPKRPKENLKLLAAFKRAY